MTPKRIQRRRTKGWRMPAGAVYVGRPSRWGNPYTFADMRARMDDIAAALGTPRLSDSKVRELVAEAFDADLRNGPDSTWWWYGPHIAVIDIRAGIDDLRGRDLVCWCPLDQACHADVLLEIANRLDPHECPHGKTDDEHCGACLDQYYDDLATGRIVEGDTP